MAKKRPASKKSVLAGKLGANAAKSIANHAADEAEFDLSGDVPAGISNGVAMLTECKFSTYEKGDNKGEPFFYAAGTVLEPKKFDGQRIEGMSVSIIEPIHDTPTRSRKTIDDHIQWVMNQLRIMGGETEGITTPEELEELATALKEEQPIFAFRTWSGEATKEYPNPRVNNVFKGVIEDYDPEEAGDDGVVDHTAEKKAAPKKQMKEEETEEEEVEEETSTEVSDAPDAHELAMLGKAADEDNEDAQERILALAEDYGITDEVNETDTWTAGTDLLNDVINDSGEEAEPEEEGTAPEKGLTGKYRPPRTKKDIEVECTAVAMGNQTCNVRGVSPPRKLFKAVAWDAVTWDA